MKYFAKSIVKSPATFIIVVLLLLLTLLVAVRAAPINNSDNTGIEIVDKTSLDQQQ